MMLKVGDKLLCKKTYQIYGKIDEYYFVDDEYYFVDDIEEVLGYVYIHKRWFSLNYSTSVGIPFVWDHFYTHQEARKEKLNKIKLCSK